MQTIKAIQSKLIWAAILLVALFPIGARGQTHTTRTAWSGWSSVTINPNAVNFGRLNVGTTSNPVTVTLHNYSRSSITISNVSLSLLQVTYSGPALPATIGAGESVQATLRFSPNAAQKYTGTLMFTESNGSAASTLISGTGVAATTPAPAPPPTTPAPPPTTPAPPPTAPAPPPTAPVPPPTTPAPPPTPANMTLSSSALTFGSVTVGSTTSQNVTVSNTGGSNLTISGVSMSGAGFNVSGVSSGQIMTPGQSSPLTVTFDPSTSGSMTGQVNISSNASSGTIALSGSGATPVSHSASLSWNLDTSSVSGYNVYSSSVSGGPYTKLTSTPVTPTSYVDSAVQAGQTYYFVVTAIGANSTESSYSNEVSTQIP